MTHDCVEHWETIKRANHGYQAVIRIPCYNKAAVQNTLATVIFMSTDYFSLWTPHRYEKNYQFFEKMKSLLFSAPMQLPALSYDVLDSDYGVFEMSSD